MGSMQGTSCSLCVRLQLDVFDKKMFSFVVYPRSSCLGKQAWVYVVNNVAGSS